MTAPDMAPVPRRSRRSRAATGITGAATALSWAAAVLMLLHVSLDIIGKALFSAPVPGTAEVVDSYYIIILVFMAFPLVEARDEVIAVDLLARRAPPLLQRAFRLLALALTLTFYLAFAWITFRAAMKSMAVREMIIGTLAFPVWPSRFFLPAGCVLAAAVVVLRQIQPREASDGSR